jgi:WD40 repeat protein
MGEYSIWLEAATGARMWLDDKLVTTVPGAAGSDTELKLNLLGGQHRLRVEYFCKLPSQKKVSLSYMGPDTETDMGNEKEIVPVAVLQHSKQELRVVPKPGFIAEYFPEEYDSGFIPEGIQPDIIRIEKQLDFGDSEPWEGLPARYKGAFAARFTTNINLACGGQKKAKYTFKLESEKCAKLFINDELVIQEDEPKEMELKKGSYLIRVDCFCKKYDRQPRPLKLIFSGPESGVEELPPAEEGGDPISRPKDVILPPTLTATYLKPTFAICKGDPLIRHEKSVVLSFWANRDTRVASVGQGGKMFFWEPTTGSFLSEFDCQSTVTCGVMGKGAVVALALDDTDHSIKIVDFEKEAEIKTLIHKSDGTEDAEVELEEGEEPPPPPLLSHEKKINAVAFNHDDSICASGSDDGILKIWEVSTGAELSTQALRAPKTDEEIPILALAFTGDGKYLLSGGKEKFIRIWDSSTGDTLRGPDIKIPNVEPEEGWPDGVEPPEETKPGNPITVEGHGAPVVCIRFSPKSATRFASCSTDATIRIWDLAVDTDAHTATLTPVIDAIQCLTPFVTWSPDAATLVSSNEDIYVSLWSAVSGKPRCEPLRGHTATVKSCAWAPSGQALVTTAEDTSVRMWHFLINRNIIEIAELEKEQMVFNNDMRQWQDQLLHIRFQYTDYNKALSDYKPQIYELRKALDEGKVRTESFMAREQLLGLELTDYFELDGMIDDYAPYYKLWDMVIKLQESEILWTNNAVKSLDATEIENQIDAWYKEVYKMIKSFDNDNMRGIHTVAKNMRAGIEDFKIRFPFLRCFANVSTKPRHWDELFKRMNIKAPADYEAITLKMMLNANILDYTEDFEELSTAAMKEHTLKKMMESMQHDWQPLAFGTNERGGSYLLSGIDEIQSVLDDHITKTQGIRSNPFCAPFQEDIHKWEHTLLYIQDFIDQTLLLQRAWMSLEPIFISDDIKQQLPNESVAFDNVDKIFRKRMAQVNEIRNCLGIAALENIVEDMKESNETVKKFRKV